MRPFFRPSHHFLRLLNYASVLVLISCIGCEEIKTPVKVSQLQTEQASDHGDQQSSQPLINPTGEELVLVFEDDFDGNELDLSVWKSREYGEAGIKHDTLRGPDNLEVKDGNLLLHVRKEEMEHKGKTAHWTAGYVYMLEPLPLNSYVEARFRPGKASGVNNAFWLACVNVEDRSETRNKYEIDIVETRRDAELENTGRGHMAWHDWKGYRYIFTEDGKNNHIAMGTNLRHAWDQYDVWGLWYGENETIYTFNGKEVWRGKSHFQYLEQWWTGLGKFDQWRPDYEKAAYGRHGQDDWVYRGGYNGDKMKVIFSNIPWGSSWTPLTDEADGDVMSVDYLRIYRPLRLLNRDPEEIIILADQQRVKIAGEANHISGEIITLGESSSVGFELDKPVAVEGNLPHYFSLEVKKDSLADFSIHFYDSIQTLMLSARVDNDNDLSVGFRSTSAEWDTKSDDFQHMASTKTAYPSSESEASFFSDKQDFLLVIRVTPGAANSRDAVSMTAFPLPLKEEPGEPYFYPNIDVHGNTNVTNGWPINQKMQNKSVLYSVAVKNSGPGDITVGAFRSGSNFLSILP